MRRSPTNVANIAFLFVPNRDVLTNRSTTEELQIAPNLHQDAKEHPCYIRSTRSHPPRHDMTRIVGIILICIGLVGLTIGGISYTTEDTLVDVGPLEVEKEEQRTIPITPLASGFVLVAGIGLVYIGRENR